MKLFFLFAISFLAQLAIAIPYRLYPGEDQKYLFKPFEWMHQPIFTFYIEAWRYLNFFLAQPIGDTLLLAMSFANAVSVTALFAIIKKVSGRVGPALIAGGLFILSAWTTNYLWMASYATLSTTLCLLLAYCVLCLVEEWNDTITIILGVVVAWAFLSSPSSLVFLGLGAVVLFGMTPGPMRQRWRRWIKPFAVSFLFVLPFLFRTVAELFAHWHANFFGDNFHFIPQWFPYKVERVWLSFPRILWFYSPTLLILFGVSLLIWGASLKRSGLKRKQTKSVLILITFLFAHSVIIDLLPSTKLARTHFPMFPFFLAALILMMSEIWLLLVPRNGMMRSSSVILLLALSAGHIADQVTKIHSARHVKQDGAQYLEGLEGTSDFYVLSSDPHNELIRMWARVGIKKISHPREIVRASGRRIVLILGPHGPMSGLSALKASIAPAFELGSLQSLKPKGALEISLPFHAYYPSFLLEEEVSQALYFQGLSPDYHSPELQLTAWIW
jgi:hypothetical protein